jgi:hypothetical protein
MNAARGDMPSNEVPSFMRALLSNLRMSFFVVIVALISVLGYALIRGSAADWNIVIFTAIGMAISSIFNALYDSRKKGARN